LCPICIPHASLLPTPGLSAHILLTCLGHLLLILSPVFFPWTRPTCSISEHMPTVTCCSTVCTITCFCSPFLLQMLHYCPHIRPWGTHSFRMLRPFAADLVTRFFCLDETTCSISKHMPTGMVLLHCVHNYLLLIPILVADASLLPTPGLSAQILFALLRPFAVILKPVFFSLG